ncbi:hypothetical protein JCM8208_002441 [Rhodotorula glutinis]
MTESNAYLAYGITVTTESLLYAVAAWPRLQGPFAFFDLIALRKRTGTLVARHSRPARQGVQTVPVEVWDVVRHKLVDLELKDAEVEHVESIMCDCAREVGYSAEDITWDDVASGCGDGGIYDFDGLDDPERRTAAKALLSAFGLALPSSVPILNRAADEYGPGSHRWSPDTSTMISLPAPPSAGDDAFGLSASCNGDLCADGQAVVDVSVSVPSGAKQRFRRLLSTMHLQLVEVTDGYIANAGTRAGKSDKGMRHKKRRFKKVSLAQLAPRWKFVTMAETQW